MKKRTKLFVFGGGGLVVAAGIIAATMSGGDDGLTEVQADLAYYDEISEIVTASGRIQPQTKVDVTSEVSAQVVELLVSEGDWVTAGQRLLQLDTVQLKADKAQAEYSLDEIKARTEAARTQFEKNKLDVKRQTKLYDQKLTSENAFTDATFAYDNSKAIYEAMQAQVKTGQARLDKAIDNLRKTTIKAPISGVVTFLNVEVGEISQAQTAFTQGKTLMTVSDLSVYEVEVDVDETEIALVKLGHKAGIRVDAFRDTVFRGIVEQIANSARVEGQGTENYATNFLVKVRFLDSDVPIRPGMSATVDITTATEENALLIPYASVVTREFDPDSLNLAAANETSNGGLVEEVQAAEGDDSPQVEQANETTSGKSRKKKKVKMTGVFKVENGKALFVELTTGIADERNIVALGGLSDQDTIISGSYQTLRKLKNGDPVKIDENSLENLSDSKSDSE